MYSGARGFTGCFRGVLLIGTCVTCLAQAAKAERRSVSLNDGWEFRQRISGVDAIPGQWHSAEVPGVVHTDLLRNKLIPDPFFRSNESTLQWIENASWEYRSTFQATPETLKHSHMELVFEGMDGPAEVYLNDKLILTANNMFREWRVEVDSQLKAGPNQLLVVFPSPITEARKVAAEDFWRQQTQTPEKSYLRKAAYEYGWDWGPRFVLSGIWRPVKLDVWDDVKISNLHVHQLDISSESAHLMAETEVTCAQKGVARITVDYEQNGRKSSTSRDVELNLGVNHIDLPIDIPHPDLWYPNGYGRQPIYAFHAQLKSGGRVQDDQTVRTGLRSIVLRRDPDQWGRSFELVVNGIPVFAKGADVIPFDSFPTRVTAAQYRWVLESAKTANMNMIRDWGGGYYETDEFYALCDELGIMIWQDFMFGNEWQPGTYDFKQNVAQEAEYQIKRLREHPSIVLWCGNNETETSWEWHLSITIKLSADVARRMWQDYLTLFSGVLASAVERFTPETPYWPSSPSADYEDISEDHQSGDMHNWDVWHGRLPFRDYEKSIPRFMTEYGFQSFPEMRTVEAFTLPEDRTGILTPVMLAHQKNTSGNAIIHDYMLRDYPEPKDFASFLYVSQVLQAEGIKIGTEHLRRNRPRTMGALYWQLNDCWPVASWASIDYYGRWKALHYYARRFYDDVLISPFLHDDKVDVYVVSDKLQPLSGTIHTRLLDFSGNSLLDQTKDVQVPAQSNAIYFTVDKASLGAKANLRQSFLVFDLEIAGKRVSRNLIFFNVTHDLELPVSPKIETTLDKASDGYTITVQSPKLARSVSLSFGDLDAQSSDNYFDLLPGEPVTLHLKSSATPDQIKGAMKVISLTDAFHSD